MGGVRDTGHGRDAGRQIVRRGEARVRAGPRGIRRGWGNGDAIGMRRSVRRFAEMMHWGRSGYSSRKSDRTKHSTRLTRGHGLSGQLSVSLGLRTDSRDTTVTYVSRAWCCSSAGCSLHVRPLTVLSLHPGHSYAPHPSIPHLYTVYATRPSHPHHGPYRLVPWRVLQTSQAVPAAAPAPPRHALHTRCAGRAAVAA